MTANGKAVAASERIAAALDKELPGLICNWIAVVEMVNGDGQRVLGTYSQAGQATWSTLGMLHQAVLQTERKAL